MEVRIQWHAFVNAHARKHISGQAYTQYILKATEALHLNPENLPLRSRLRGFCPFYFSPKTYSKISKALVSQEGARNKVSNSACSTQSRRDSCRAQQTQRHDCLQWGNVTVQHSLAFPRTCSISFSGNHDGGVEGGGEMEHAPLTHPLQSELSYTHISRSW